VLQESLVARSGHTDKQRFPVPGIDFRDNGIEAGGFIAGGVELELGLDDRAILLLERDRKQEIGEAKKRQGTQNENKRVPRG